MSKTTVTYKDVAPGAAEEAVVATASATAFSQPDRLPFAYEQSPVSSLEQNCWVLDGTFMPYDTQNIAFWSSEISQEDRSFASAPVITLETENQYSSTGISLFFDGDSWASEVNIQWYRGNTLLYDMDFTPDKMEYFCQKQVESYNKIVLTFRGMSLPGRRLKLRQILFGLYRKFGMSELRSASIVNESSQVSSELPISKLSWSLDSHTDVAYMFQLKQPVEVVNSDSLIGVYYIDSFTRSAENLYNLECYDAIGVLGEMPFSGGVYHGASAKGMLAEIMGDTFQIEYSEGVADTALTGIIEKGTKREAIQQVLFAWGVCGATDGSSALRIYVPGTAYVDIGVGRTFAGPTVETAAIVTAVAVTAHSYTEDSGGSIEINGRKYAETRTVYTVRNPRVTANDKENVVEVENATLVSNNIVAGVAQRVYDYYLRRNTTSASIVWSGEKLGDAVTVPNNWGGRQSGNIGRMEIKLSNTVVADVKVR